MAEGRKRLKTDEIDTIFYAFRSDEVKRKQLVAAVSALENGLQGLSLGFLHLDVLNAHKNRNFPDALIECSTLKVNCDPKGSEKPYSLCASVLFTDGVDILKQYADQKKPKIPTDVLQRRALRNLLVFISTEAEDQELFFEEMASEGQWCVILAQHLLSKLTVNSNYSVASYLGVPAGRMKCLCNQNDDLVGTVGDTSYGCENGWHGSSDIILEGADVQVAYIREESEEKDASASRMADSSTMSYQQIIAQTIVFSFLQKKMCRNKLKNCLIPGVGISRKKLIAFFYDSENDILLSTRPLVLFGNNEIGNCSLVFLWLVLNYRQFCSGVPDAFKSFKAGFLDNPEVRHMYDDEVARPMHVRHTKEEAFTWSEEKTIPCESRKPNVEYEDLQKPPDN